MMPPSDENNDGSGRPQLHTTNAEAPSAPYTTCPKRSLTEPTKTPLLKTRTQQSAKWQPNPPNDVPRYQRILTKRHLTSLVLLLLRIFFSISSTTMADVVMLDAQPKGKRPASTPPPSNPSKKATKSPHASPPATPKKKAGFTLDSDETIVETTANPSLHLDTLKEFTETDRTLAITPYSKMFGEGPECFHDDLRILLRMATRELYDTKHPNASQTKTFSEDKGDEPLFPKLAWITHTTAIIQNTKKMATLLSAQERNEVKIIYHRLAHSEPKKLFGKVTRSTVPANHAARAWHGAVNTLGSFYIKPKPTKKQTTKKGQNPTPLAGQQLLPMTWKTTPGKAGQDPMVITPENNKGDPKVSAVTKMNTMANSCAETIQRPHYTRLQIMIKLKADDTASTNDMAIKLIKALFKRYKENDPTTCILPWKIANMKTATAIHKPDKLPMKMSELKKTYAEGLRPKANSNCWFKLHLGSTEKSIHFTSLNDSDVQDFFLDNDAVAYKCSVQESDDTVDLCDLLYSGGFTNAGDLESTLRKYIPPELKFGCRTKKSKEIPEPKHSKDWLLKPNMMVHIETDRRHAKPIKAILHRLFNAPEQGAYRPGGYNVRVLPEKSQLKLGTKGDSDRIKMLQKHQAIVSSLTVIKSHDLRDLNDIKKFNDTDFNLREHLLNIKYPLGDHHTKKSTKSLFFSVDYAPSGSDKDQGVVYFTAYNDRASIASKLVDIMPAFMINEYGEAQAQAYVNPASWGDHHNTDMINDNDGNWIGEWTTPDDAMGEYILNEDMGVELLSFDNMALLDEGFNTRVLLTTEDASVCTFGTALGRTPPNDDQSDTVVPGARHAAIDSDSDSNNGGTEMSGAVAD